MLLTLSLTHAYLAFQQSFDDLPDELIIRILAELDPEDVLLNLSVCSRRMWSISNDNVLWGIICGRSLSICSTGGSRFVADHWIKGPAHAEPGAIAQFWKLFVRNWEPRFGWWVDIHGMRGVVYRISADMTTGVIRQHLLILGNRATRDDYSIRIPASFTRHADIGMVAVPSTVYGSLFLGLLDPDHLLRLQDAEATYDAEEGGTNFSSDTGRLSAVNTRLVDLKMKGSSVVHSLTGTTVYPSAALMPAFNARASDNELTIWNVPSLRIDEEQVLAQLCPPLFDDGRNIDSSSSPIRLGWYTGTYGPHGCELIYMRMVDPSIDLILLEPPHDTLPSGGLTMTSRRIEAVKITGDPNIPKGVRTFVAFLDAPEMRIGPNGIPARSSRQPGASWPLDELSFRDALHTTEHANPDVGVLEDIYAAPSGMTMPGLGRVAADLFRRPRWTDAVVHVASPEEIQVFFTELRVVSTYRWFRIEDVSETSI